jgi:hypothetical protein
MNELNYPETTKHVIAHNGENLYSYNIVEPQNCFASGQPFMEVFDTEEAAKIAFPQAFSEPEPEITPLDNYQEPLITDLYPQSDNQI